MVAGTWMIARKKQTATLALTPFGKLSKKVQAELREEGDALLEFVEGDAERCEVRI